MARHKHNPTEPKKDQGSGPKSPALRPILRNQYVLLAILAVIALAVYGSFVFSDRMLSSSDQLTGIDSRVMLHDALVKHGQFPTWMQSRLGGMPSQDAMFGDAMYVLSLVLYTILPMHRALGMIMVVHVILAGIFFYFMLAKGFGLPPLVSFVGAALYMLNPEFVSHTYPGHSGKMMVIAWLPYVVWRMKVLMERPGVLNATFLAFGVSICLFTSHTQMTYFTLWGLFLVWVMTLVLLWIKKRDMKSLMPQGVFFWAAVLLAVGLAFIQFFPSFMFIRDAYSVRGVERGFEYAASWSMHWPEFFSLWVPEFGNFLDNYWSENVFKLNTEYAGAVALLFAVCAVCFRPSPWRIFWAAVAVLAALYSLGAHTPLFHLAYYLVPGVKKFRAPSIMMFWFSFGVVLLASLFLGDIAAGRLFSMDEARKKKWQKGLFIAIGAVTALAVLFSAKGFVAGLMQGVLLDVEKARIFEANFGANFVPALWIWWVIAVVCIAMVLAVLNRKLSVQVALAVVLILGLFDTIRVDRKFIQVINPRKYFAEDPTLATLAASMNDAPFRCYSLPGTFPQNAEGIYRLEGVGDFHDNELRWYREFRGDQRGGNYLHTLIGYDAQGRPYLRAGNLQNGNNFLNLANVRYYLTRQGSGIASLENRGALGRLSFAPSYVVMEEQGIAAALKDGRYDIRTTVCLLEEPEKKPSPVATDSSGAALPVGFDVVWEKYTPNYRRARITAQRDGFVRLSEVWYPGWEIRIDGQKTRIYRSDLAWMAVYVDAGEHTVEMMPKSLYLGTASLVSLPLIATLLICWVVVAVAYLRKKGSGGQVKDA